MMENKLQCEIVQDLLPSYVDGLTSDVTNEAIRGHMETCDVCRNMKERMQEPKQVDSDLSQDKEIDFLKKTRSKTRHKIGLSVLLAAAAAIAVIFLKFYCLGSDIYAESLACKAMVYGQTLTISGTLTDSALGISQINYEENDGVVTVSFKATLASPFHKGDFSSEYTAENPITQVRLGDRIIWDHGISVSANVSAAYNAKHAYIGDMTENGKSTAALGMVNVLGNIENELQTDREPYGWKMILKDEVSDKKQSMLEQQMKSYAYVLLATIGNLGYVTYDYRAEGGSTSLTVTAKDAGIFAGKDIKACADTAADLQRLMQKTGLNEYGISSAETSGKSLNLKIVQNSDSEIYGVEINYYIDGKLCGSRGCANADGSVINKSEILDFEFVPEDFGQDLKEAAKIWFEAEVYGREGNVYKVSSPVQIPADYGYSYNYVLSGNIKEGFKLEQ